VEPSEGFYRRFFREGSTQKEQQRQRHVFSKEIEVKNEKED
jgi:hypothetical protein